jgi:glycosyltransferase involved in cell wall biosynthesis
LTSHSQYVVEKAIGSLDCQKTVIPHCLSTPYLRLELPPDTLFVGSYSKYSLLYVSTIDQYKHQWNVVEGVAIARKKLKLDLRLTLIGNAYQPALNKLNHALRRFDPHAEWSAYIGPIAHERLFEYYAKANVFIWASTCETFGIPILEASQCNLPIICSNYEPMMTMLGDAAIYFDPLCPSTLSDAIESLFENPVLSHILVRHAREKLSTSSACVAKKTFAFLRQIMFYD